MTKSFWKGREVEVVAERDEELVITQNGHDRTIVKPNEVEHFQPVTPTYAGKKRGRKPKIAEQRTNASEEIPVLGGE